MAHEASLTLSEVIPVLKSTTFKIVSMGDLKEE